jgi:hypothetical protein
MTSLVVEISGPVADKLRLLVDAEKRSESEIIGDALTAYASARRKLPTGTGKYHSGRSDNAQNAEDILRQAVEEGKWP